MTAPSKRRGVLSRLAEWLWGPIPELEFCRSCSSRRDPRCAGELCALHCRLYCGTSCIDRHSAMRDAKAALSEYGPLEREDADAD